MILPKNKIEGERRKRNPLPLPNFLPGPRSGSEALNLPFSLFLLKPPAFSFDPLGLCKIFFNHSDVTIKLLTI